MDIRYHWATALLLLAVLLAALLGAGGANLLVGAVALALGMGVDRARRTAAPTVWRRAAALGAAVWATSGVGLLRWGRAAQGDDPTGIIPLVPAVWMYLRRVYAMIQARRRR